MTPAAQLMSVAEQMRIKEGGSGAAARLIAIAAVMLLLDGVRPDDLTNKLADAIRDYEDEKPVVH